MPKLKITEPGWEGFTGLLGITQFTDGVSDEDLNINEARRLATIVRMEDVVDGKNHSITQHVIDTRCIGADEAEKAQREAEAKPPEVDTKVAPVYTRAQLEALADADGIKSIREIGDKLGVKDASIAGLIKKILDKVDPEAAAPAPAPAAPEEPAVPEVPEAPVTEEVAPAEEPAADAPTE